jgi:hypothetical protein
MTVRGVVFLLRETLEQLSNAELTIDGKIMLALLKLEQKNLSYSLRLKAQVFLSQIYFITFTKKHYSKMLSQIKFSFSTFV